MGANNFGYGVSLRRGRNAIQFEQDQAADPKALANDQLAEIAILRNQNPAFGIRQFEDNTVRCARPRFADRYDVEAIRS